MTGRTLYNRIVAFGISPSEEQVIGWLDAWQKDIAAEAGKLVRHTFDTITAGQEIVLPTDFASVVEFRYEGKEYSKTDDIRLDEEGYITFPETLTSPMVMRYRKLPTDYASLDTPLEPHALLQPLAYYYCISLYYDKSGEGDEESGMAARWMQMYEMKKNEVLAKIASPTGNEPSSTKDELPKRQRYHHPALTEEDDDCV